MKNIESQFQLQSTTIKVTPHERTWDRIEAKLEAHRSRRKLLSARLMSIAAAVSLLVVVSLSVFYYMQNQHTLQSKVYTMSIEQIRLVDTTGDDLYDVSNIRRSYADLQK